MSIQQSYKVKPCCEEMSGYKPSGSILHNMESGKDVETQIATIQFYEDAIDVKYCPFCGKRIELLSYKDVTASITEDVYTKLWEIAHDKEHPGWDSPLEEHASKIVEDAINKEYETYWKNKLIADGTYHNCSFCQYKEFDEFRDVQHFCTMSHSSGKVDVGGNDKACPIWEPGYMIPADYLRKVKRE